MTGLGVIGPGHDNLASRSGVIAPLVRARGKHPRENRRETDAFMLKVPGPSSTLRPLLPNRNEFSGTVGKAVRSNHWSTVGALSAPFDRRSGRLASPLVKLKLATLGVKGEPVYMVVVPASCPSRRTRFLLKLGDQMKLAAKACPVSKSLRPRSPFRFFESWALPKLY